MASLMGMKDEQTGEFITWAWPGGYPVFYLDNKDQVVCPKCANDPEEWEFGDTHIVVGDVNWEDPDLYCDYCSKRIESAYAEDDEEKPEEGD